MNVFVGCSANNIDRKYIELAYSLAYYLNENNYQLIYGGSVGGEMLALGETVNNKISVTLNRESIDSDIKVETTGEATYKMLELADVIIIMPGGIGTLMELSTAIHMKRVNELNKRIILINYNCFYDKLLKYFEFLNEENFFESVLKSIEIIDDIKYLSI